MDLKKTGDFIKQQRKAKNLTQAQLAGKIAVSEKTISKWECGNGFPDATLLLPLCEALGISANELLSAKKLDEKEYKKEAENNLIVLQAEKESNDRVLLLVEWVLGILSLIVLLVPCFVATFVQMQTWTKVLIVVLGFVIGFAGLFFCTVIEAKAGYYECKICGNKRIPTNAETFFAIHFGRTRFMKCPKCSKHTWHKKVLK